MFSETLALYFCIIAKDILLSINSKKTKHNKLFANLKHNSKYRNFAIFF